MAITEAVNHFVTYTDWNGYCKFLDAVADSRTRVTYDRGTLELMSPGQKHEAIKGVMGILGEALMRRKKLKFKKAGSTTFRRQDLDCGLEPDECYWIAHVLEVLGVKQWDPLVHPPPDLAIEVDVSSSSIDRMGIYASLGVPEVWRYRRNDTVSVHVLSGNAYHCVEQSPIFPQLSISTFADFARRGELEATSDILDDFEIWLRDNPI